TRPDNSVLAHIAPSRYPVRRVSVWSRAWLPPHIEQVLGRLAGLCTPPAAAPPAGALDSWLHRLEGLVAPQTRVLPPYRPASIAGDALSGVCHSGACH